MKQGVPGFIHAFGFTQAGPPIPVNEDVVAAGGHAGWLWLHLNLIDNRCGAWLAQRFPQAAQAAQSFVRTEPRPIVDVIGQSVVAKLPGFRHEFEGESQEEAMLHALLLPDLLITGRNRSLAAPERLRQAVARGVSFSAPADLLSALESWTIGDIEVAARRIAEGLDQVEDTILDDRKDQDRRRLMILRRELSRHHRHVRAARRALGRAEAAEGLPAALVPLLQRLDGLDQDFSSLEQIARAHHDEIDAKLAAETNRQLYVLSVLTAMFLPPTLVAGLFGMNFDVIPLSSATGGFYVEMALCAASSISVGMFLRRRRDR